MLGIELLDCMPLHEQGRGDGGGESSLQFSIPHD